MARTLTIRQRDSLRQFQPVANPPPVLSAGQPLEIYRERSPWNMWGPVLALSVIVAVAAVAIFHLAMTGWVNLAEIGLAQSELDLEHARLMAEADSFTQGEVLGYVAAVLLGVLALPAIAITCARR